MKPIGIVTATRWEAAPLIKAFGFQRIEKNLWKTQAEGAVVFLCLSGVGQKAARAAALRLCQNGAKELISAGFCGALVPELHVGDLVTHRLLTVDTPVRTAAERRALTAKTQPIAVDMETQAIIEAGTLRGVPIRACRIVSDELEEDLTPLFGSDAWFRPWKIALRLLNPAVWPLAKRLRKNILIASDRLVTEIRTCLQTPAAR